MFYPTTIPSCEAAVFSKSQGLGTPSCVEVTKPYDLLSSHAHHFPSYAHLLQFCLAQYWNAMTHRKNISHGNDSCIADTLQIYSSLSSDELHCNVLIAQYHWQQHPLFQVLAVLDLNL